MPLNKEELAKSAKRLDIYEFREGVNVLRVLPPDLKYFTEDIGYIAFKYLAHWGVGPEGSPPVTCPRSFSDTARCPICEKVRALKNNPAYKEFVSSIYPSTRYIFNVIDVDHPEKGIQVMEVGPMVYDGILKCALDADYGDVLDLDTGRNFKVTLIPGSKSKTGRNRYETLPSANPSSIKDKLPEGWKGKIAELQGTIRSPQSYEELAGLLTGSVEATQSQATPPEHAKVTGAAKPQPSTPATESASPPTVSSPLPPTASPPPPSTGAPSTQEGVPQGNPPCFGKEYTPSSERCKACQQKLVCMTEWVRT